jgi:hypothetical protein
MFLGAEFASGAVLDASAQDTEGVQRKEEALFASLRTLRQVVEESVPDAWRGLLEQRVAEAAQSVKEGVEGSIHPILEQLQETCGLAREWADWHAKQVEFLSEEYAAGREDAEVAVREWATQWYDCVTEWHTALWDAGGWHTVHETTPNVGNLRLTSSHDASNVTKVSSKEPLDVRAIQLEDVHVQVVHAPLIPAALELYELFKCLEDVRHTHPSHIIDWEENMSTWMSVGKEMMQHAQNALLHIQSLTWNDDTRFPKPALQMDVGEFARWTEEEVLAELEPLRRAQDGVEDDAHTAVTSSSYEARARPTLRRHQLEAMEEYYNDMRAYQELVELTQAYTKVKQDEIHNTVHMLQKFVTAWSKSLDPELREQHRMYRTAERDGAHHLTLARDDAMSTFRGAMEEVWRARHEEMSAWFADKSDVMARERATLADVLRAHANVKRYSDRLQPIQRVLQAFANTQHVAMELMDGMTELSIVTHAINLRVDLVRSSGGWEGDGIAASVFGPAWNGAAPTRVPSVVHAHELPDVQEEFEKEPIHSISDDEQEDAGMTGGMGGRARVPFTLPRDVPPSED